MLFEEIKKIKSTRKEQRHFGLTIGLFLAVLGGIFLWRQKDFGFALLVVAEIFLIISLVVPRLLKKVYQVWMGFSLVVGWLMTRVILTLLFFLVVTPMGLSARLLKKDFLDLKFRDGKKSNWLLKPKRKFLKNDYEKQF